MMTRERKSGEGGTYAMWYPLREVKGRKDSRNGETEKRIKVFLFILLQLKNSAQGRKSEKKKGCRGII